MEWDKRKLEILYWQQNKSASQIAQLYGCTERQVIYQMQKLGIPRRMLSQATFIAKSKCQDKEMLTRLYIREQKSTHDIAKILDTSKGGVVNALRRFNIPLRTKEERNQLAARKLSRPKGEKAYNWKGGRVKQSGGYIKIQCLGHPYADSKGYILEHRLVMEKKLGRYLLPWERVHHIDGRKDYNTEDNLQLISPTDHTLYARMCAHCELRVKVRTLEWRIKQLEEALQYKLREEV